MGFDWGRGLVDDVQVGLEVVVLRLTLSALHRCRYHNRFRLLLLHYHLILLLCLPYLLRSLLPLLILPLHHLLPIPHQLRLEPLLLLNLCPLLLLPLPPLHLHLFLQHPLQLLLLPLLPLVHRLRYLHEPVHRPRYRRPRVLKRLLQLRHCAPFLCLESLLLWLHDEQVGRGVLVHEGPY
jgi:hypothetical protein